MVMVDGFQGRWSSNDVYGKMWGQCVPAGDAVPCRGFLDGLGDRRWEKKCMA